MEGCAFRFLKSCLGLLIFRGCSFAVLVFLLHEVESRLAALEGCIAADTLLLGSKGIVVGLLDFLVKCLLGLFEHHLLIGYLQTGLAHAGLKKFFPNDDLVISAEDRGWAKRKPETFEKVCALLGTQPAETWLFDDSWYSPACAREVGLRTVGVFSSDLCGSHEELARYCDVVIDDFTGLNPADYLK